MERDNYELPLARVMAGGLNALFLEGIGKC